MQRRAGGAILIGQFGDGGDALSDHDGAGDDPIDRAAIEDFRGAAGEAAGQVAKRRVGGKAARLELTQVGDVADPDRQLHHVQHGSGLADARRGGKPAHEERRPGYTLCGKRNPPLIPERTRRIVSPSAATSALVQREAK